LACLHENNHSTPFKVFSVTCGPSFETYARLC
jgi:hypothetical protein